jgi:hypothetical protein
MTASDGTRSAAASPAQDDPPATRPAILSAVDPLDRLRSAGKRMTDPLDSVAQRVAELVVDLIVRALDVNALLQRVDVNALLARLDVNELLARVDVNALAARIDMDALVEHTDLGAVIAQSSGGLATEALDAARSSAVGLDGFIDRCVDRVVRRRHPAPVAPPAFRDAAAVRGGPPQ